MPLDLSPELREAVSEAIKLASPYAVKRAMSWFGNLFADRQLRRSQLHKLVQHVRPQGGFQMDHWACFVLCVALAGCGADPQPTGSGGHSSSSGGAGGSGGAACAIPCANDCCVAGEQCFTSDTGVSSCAKTCDSSDQCPASAPCCELLKDLTGACVAPTDAAFFCRCHVGSECQSGSCSPYIDATHLGPYVCTLNDGGPYDGCNDGVPCAGTLCCVMNEDANNFCAVAGCINDADCAPGHCYPGGCATGEGVCAP